MKVLIVTPDIHQLGGVQSYYLKMRPEFSPYVDYFIFGQTGKGLLNRNKIIKLLFDYFIFIKILFNENYEVVHVNPSLDRIMFFREGLFVFISSIFRKKIVVFFRGWNKDFERFIQNYALFLFHLLYGATDAFIVLAEDFKNVLRIWGCQQPIFKEVTIIPEKIVRNINLQKVVRQRLDSEYFNILFLSRVTRKKGIFKVINAFIIAQKTHQNLRLFIAGTGPSLTAAKEFVIENNIQGIHFEGYIRDERKYALLESSHLMMLPTMYGEGLPNSIVEAMAFGLPVITRFVGGIKDFFQNGKHGFATYLNDPVEYAKFILILANDKQLYKRISFNNHEIAKFKFSSLHAAKRLEKIYEKVVSG